MRWKVLRIGKQKTLSNCAKSLLHVLLTINFEKKKEELETFGELSFRCIDVPIFVPNW